MHLLRFAAAAAALGAALCTTAAPSGAQSPPGTPGSAPVDPSTVGPPLPAAAAKPAPTAPATTTPAPPPPSVAPVFTDGFDGLSSSAPLDRGWDAVAGLASGAWTLDETRGELHGRAPGPAGEVALAARKRFNTSQGLAVAVNLHLAPASGAATGAGDACGILISQPAPPPGVPLPPGGPKLAIALVRGADGTAALEVAPARVPLPKDFRVDDIHQMVVLYRPVGGKLEVRIDGATRYQASNVTVPATAQVSLLVRRTEAAFDGIAVAESGTASSLLPPPLVATAAAQPGAQKVGWRLNGDVIEQKQLGATPQTYEVEGQATSAVSGSAGVIARGWATGNALASPRYGLRIRIDGKAADGADASTGYVDALIDPVGRTLTTRAVIGGREALASQSTALSPQFDFTEEHRIRIAWDAAGRAWNFAVDNDPKSTQERSLASLPALEETAPADTRRFVPVLVTEDTRAVYWGLSVNGAAASAAGAPEPEGDPKPANGTPAAGMPPAKPTTPPKAPAKPTKPAAPKKPQAQPVKPPAPKSA